MRDIGVVLLSLLFTTASVTAQTESKKGIGTSWTEVASLEAEATQLDSGSSQDLRIQKEILHQKAMAAGGRLVEYYHPNASSLAGDLPALAQLSDQILLVHVLKIYIRLNVPGNIVCIEYEMQVLRSWKGASAPGDLVRVRIPAGSYSFPDGVQVLKVAKGLAPPRDGERHVVFLHKSSLIGENPSFELAGGGVQGAFLLADAKSPPADGEERLAEKVYPAYGMGWLAKNYSGLEVLALFRELDYLTGK